MDQILPMAFQATGLIIIIGVVSQVVVAVIASARRSSYLREKHVRSLELLDNHIEAARRHRALSEQEIHTWQGFRKFEVQKKSHEGGDICSFYLKPHDARPIPPFKAGQFLTFKLDIPGDKQITRCYSLSSIAHEENYRVSIKRVPPPRGRDDLPPGKSSNFFRDHIEESDILDVKAPGGNFFLDVTRTTPIVLIGGGIGLTPVLSMLEAVVRHGFQRDVHFFYGVRNSDEHIMKDYLESLDAEHRRLTLHICYSNPTPTDVQGKDFHHAERVSVDLFKRLFPSNNYEFYICGPPPMMESLVKDLDEWRVPESAVNFEAFGPASVKKTTPKPADGEAGAEKTLKITFQKSGKEISWTPSSGSLLETAEANGIELDAGCRAGNCGTCLTAVRSGDVSYLNEPGEMPESGSCLVCVGVPKSDLVLDA